MYRKMFLFVMALVFAFGMPASESVVWAQNQAPCAMPGTGPRDGSGQGQGQGLRDGKGNGPRNGQGYGPKRRAARGLHDGSGRGQAVAAGRGRGLTLRDGSCLSRNAQPGSWRARNQ